VVDDRSWAVEAVSDVERAAGGLSLVFKGSVEWTEKMTETELNLTECNRTVGCGCPLWRVVRLSVASIRKYLKTARKPVAISCNQFSHSICNTTYVVNVTDSKLM
jgi:hypothetical protein